MKAKYIGDPNDPKEQKNLPDEFTAYGITFERGKSVDVPEELEAKFANNSHFETDGEPEAKRGPGRPRTAE